MEEILDLDELQEAEGALSKITLEIKKIKEK